MWTSKWLSIYAAASPFRTHNTAANGVFEKHEWFSEEMSHMDHTFKAPNEDADLFWKASNNLSADE